MNMNQKGFANIILISIIVVLVGVVGYFVLTKQSGAPTTQQNSQTSQQLTAPSSATTQNPSQQISNQATTDETSNWKTYRNDTYGFEIKYPVEAQEVSGKKLPGENILFALSLASSKTAEIVTVNLSNCYYSPLGQSIAKKNVSVGGSSFCLNIEEDSGTGGQKARDYYYTTRKGSEYLLISFHIIYNSYCGKYPEYNCAKFDETKETNIFNQILSTFKFTR